MLNCKWIAFWIPKELFEEFRIYTKIKNRKYFNDSGVEVTGKEIIYFSLKKMIEDDSFKYEVIKENSREKEEYLSAQLPIDFIKVFEKYFIKKKREAEEIGEKLKVKKKWLLIFALKQVMTGDLFKR